MYLVNSLLVQRWCRTGMVLVMLGLLAGCHFDDDDDDNSTPPAEVITESGRQTLMSSGMERYFHLNLPTDYQWGEEPRPLEVREDHGP